MTSNRNLEAARDALEALESRRAELLAAVEGARRAVSDAEAERDELISRAAAGDKKATRDVIRRADEAWREAQISIQIEEAKVSAIEKEISQAEIEVMCAKARTLSADLRSALAAEAAAFDAFVAKIREAMTAMGSYEQAQMNRFVISNLARSHNSSRDVLRVAHPNRPEQDVWQDPRPVTITQNGSMFSASRDRYGETIEVAQDVNVQKDEPSVLATILGPSDTVALGDVCAAILQPMGWTVRGLKDLEELGKYYYAVRE